MKTLSLNLLILVSVLLIYCSEGEVKTRSKFPDPYADSFKGKNIRAMISFDPTDSSVVDSVLFDKQGNLERRKAIWVNEQKEFDGLNFIVRSLSKNEQYSNYYISYSSDSDGNLIQTWNALGHYKWDFTPSDIKQADSSNYSVKFVLDKNGRVVREVDQYHGIYSNYIYEQSGELTAKEIFSAETDSIRAKWTYRYKDNQLGAIQYFFKDRLIISHMYNDGLPDSTVLDDGTVYRHKYFYY